MANTISTYKTLVQNEVDDTSSRAGSVIERAIKDTYQEIIRHTFKWIVESTEEDVVATSSQRYVELTTAPMRVTNVLWKTTGGSDFQTLKRIEEEDYLNIYVNRNAADPQHYYVKGDKVYFDIAPDNAGTARVVYYAVQNELTGAQTSIIADRFTQAVVLGSVSRFKAYEGLPDAREYDRLYRGSFGAQGRIEGALGDMIRELSVKQRTIRPKLYNRN